MDYAQIFQLDGTIYADGLQSGLFCDEAVNAARNIAAIQRKSVVVEDHALRQCYRVTPGGYIWTAPRGWVSDWKREDDE